LIAQNGQKKNIEMTEDWARAIVAQPNLREELIQAIDVGISDTKDVIESLQNLRKSVIAEPSALS